jgi:mono/diheme cytochrome c family protein
MKRVWCAVLACLLAGPLLMAARDGGSQTGGWLAKVPDGERSRVNPVAGQQDAIAAGRVLYQDRCAQCHGANAEGRGKRPPLRSARVAGASDGELFWLLTNGYRGMPRWSRLPEPERWQIVAYLRNLQARPHEVPLEREGRAPQ